MSNKDEEENPGVPLKVTSGRKVTLPKDICEKLGVEEGDHIVLEMKGGEAIMRPFKNYEVKQ